MNPSNITRIQYEFKEIILNKAPYYSVGLEDKLNWYNWNILLYGPVGSPYEQGIFHVKMEIPFEYPFKAPKVTWLTPIFHPQINKLNEKDPGNLCLRVISHSGEWNPSMKLHEILVDLYTLLSKPTVNKFVREPGEILSKDPKLYEEKAREWTIKYACNS